MLDRDPQRALRSLNDLGHLSSGVGHHVINAFSAIVSNAEMLRLKLTTTSPIDPSVVADTIINTALEAATVARHLIDFTRPITTIGEDRLALDRLVADHVDSIRRASPAGVSWSTDLAPVPPIRGQADHLRSMLDLVLANAFEAMSGDSIDIFLATSVDNRGWVALEIRDSGRGMTPEDKERAVEPFFSTKSGHLGVGLSIANGIWRRHRGTLSLRTLPGKGTTLRLCVEPSEA